MKKVLIADDHAVVRKGVEAVLSDHPDLQVGGEATDAREVLEKVRDVTWDLVILDLAMPGGEGLETLRRIRTIAPDLPVVILSMHPEDQMAARLLEAGANGYVQKEAVSSELVTAIRRVLGGQRYVSPAMASKLASDLGGDPTREPHELLSDREFQVLRMLGSGKTVSGIAEELVLSVKTVSTYRTRLMDKMEMQTTAEIIRYAIENDLAQ